MIAEQGVERFEDLEDGPESLGKKDDGKVPQYSWKDGRFVMVPMPKEGKSGVAIASFSPGGPGGTSTIADATDFTDTTGPATDGYSIVWDNDTGKFVLSKISASPAGSTGQIQYNGGGVFSADGGATINAATPSPNDPKMTILRTSGVVEASPIITMCLQNDGTLAGGSNYQNEVHLRLQANGPSGQSRRYINFAGGDGVDDWLTGANGDNNWILYDATPANGNHRLWMEPIPTSGHTYINSAGSGSVIINGHDDTTDNQGTGGLIVGAGGGDTLTKFRINGDGTFFTGTTPSDQRYHGYVYNSVTQTTGGSAGGLIVSSNASPASGAVSFFGVNCSMLGSGTNPIGSLTGGFFQTTHIGSGTLTNAYGGYFQNNISSGNVSNQYAGFFNNIIGSGKVSTSMYGLWVAAPSGGGTYTNYRGLRILNAAGTNLTWGIQCSISSGTQKFNIYADGTASNYFNGNVGIGTTAPNEKLEVVGTARVDGLRIDQTPTAETPTPTHTIIVNLNGTDYKIPCVAA